jgi:5-methylcytosine-specific restriction endonuclease McrA
MKQCFGCKKDKESVEFTKNRGHKDGLESRCKECIKIYNSLYYNKNKEIILAKAVLYNAGRKEERAVYFSKWKSEHEEEKRISDAKWRAENKEKIVSYRAEHKEEAATYNLNYLAKHKDEIHARQKEYKKANSGKVNALTAKRLACKINATPKWLNETQLLEIQDIYVKAARLTKETGIKHQVDHIIPLQGKLVRGLHVPWNLQILTASENLSKGNKVDFNPEKY